MTKRLPAYLTGVSQRRTHEPVGHAFHPPKRCADCGKPVPDMKGTERGGIKRCGPCDIQFCEGADTVLYSEDT